MQQVKKDEIEDFLRQVPEMTVMDFEVVRKAAVTDLPVRRGARPMLKLGGADANWLDKLVRDTVRPLLTSLTWPDVGLSSMVVPLVLGACQAIIRRDRLSQEQYEAFVGPFRRVGLTLPVWQSPEK